jgi:hypothetical protein
VLHLGYILGYILDRYSPSKLLVFSDFSTFHPAGFGVKDTMEPNPAVNLVTDNQSEPCQVRGSSTHHVRSRFTFTLCDLRSGSVTGLGCCAPVCLAAMAAVTNAMSWGRVSVSLRNLLLDVLTDLSLPAVLR